MISQPKMKKTIVLAIMLICTLSVTFAQSKHDSDFELYILIGQSNMAGRGTLSPEFQAAVNPRVYMFTKDNLWVLAKDPLHFDKPKAVGVGPGLTFGIAMASSNPVAKIGLVPCAVGGTAIEVWQPGGFDKATQTHPYDDALIRIRAAMQYGQIRGVIWHQGEANSTEKKSSSYLMQLDTLVKRIRKEVGNPKLPFVVGELGRYRTQYNLINVQLAKVPDLIPYAGLVSSEGLVHKGDSTHFDGPSAKRLGQRYAEKMIKLQKQQ